MIWIAFSLLAIVALAACAPVRVLNALAGANGSGAVSRDVAYGDLPRQKLDVYTPSSAAPKDGWPVVVFFYGGSWNTGERADYRFVGRALATRGVLTLVADYRLYPEVRFPEFLVDGAQAVAFGLDQASRLGGNADRLFVMGHSAGAYNAAMLALDPRWLAAVGRTPGELAGFIGLAGPYDFLPTEVPAVRPVFFHPNYPPKSQPIEFPSPASPRTFLAAPANDKVVNPKRSTKSLAARLESAGVRVTLRLYERAGHSTLIGAFAWPLRFVAPVLDDVVTFIDAAPPRR